MHINVLGWFKKTSISNINAPILIVAPQWIGDAVMALSLIQTLHRNYPDRAIDLIATPWVAPVFEGQSAIRHLLIFNAQRGRMQWGERRSFAREVIAPLHHGIAYILPNSWKSALLPWMANIPIRIGTLGESRFGLLTQCISYSAKENGFHQAWRYRALMQASPPSPYGLISPNDTPLLSTNSDQIRSAILRWAPNVDPAYPWVVLCIGAEYGPAKQWPSTHWQILIADLFDKHYGVIILGSAKDELMQSEILSKLTPTSKDILLPLCGKTTLAEAITLIAHATAVFSNDSGLMHVAAALKKPLIAFFGSSNEHITTPLAHEGVPSITLAKSNLSCRPCLAKTCRFGHYDCLQSISPKEAILAFTQAISLDLKTTLRNQYRARLQTAMRLDQHAINASLVSRLINICEQQLHQQTQPIVGIYIAIHDEPNISLFFEAARRRQWRLAIPSMIPPEKALTKPTMHYRLWSESTALSALPIYSFGKTVIPQGDGESVLPQVLVIPCIGFSEDGFRLGYGGGYFDRYLAKINDLSFPLLPTIIGISLEESRIQRDFVEPHDIPLPTILTPQRIIMSSTRNRVKIVPNIPS